MWTRVLFVVAVAGGVLAVLAWALGFWDLGGAERGDDTIASRARLERFEDAAEAQEEPPSRTAASVLWLGADVSNAFRDCDNLAERNIAVALHPGSVSGDTNTKKIARRGSVRPVDLADSAIRCLRA